MSGVARRRPVQAMVVVGVLVAVLARAVAAEARLRQSVELAALASSLRMPAAWLLLASLPVDGDES